MSKLGQAGDTIIEVLICILVVSLILTGAYVTTHQAKLGIQNSQEHAEALKLVEGQLEQLRQNAQTSGGAGIFTIGSQFCMVNSKPVTVQIGDSQGSCMQNSSGLQADSGLVYTLTIDRKNCGNVTATCVLFVAKATWDNVDGHSINSEQLAYRLYK